MACEQVLYVASENSFQTRGRNRKNVKCPTSIARSILYEKPTKTNKKIEFRLELRKIPTIWFRKSYHHNCFPTNLQKFDSSHDTKTIFRDNSKLYSQILLNHRTDSQQIERHHSSVKTTLRHDWMWNVKNIKTKKTLDKI